MDVMQDIQLYEQIVPQVIKERLQAIRRTRTESNWEIGRLALEAAANLKTEQDAGRMEGVHLYHVWHAFFHFCHISPRRVEKLSRIFEAYPAELRERYAKYDFGYFEKAFDFRAEYRQQALEFLDWFESEYHRQARVTEFQFLFRKHILGEAADVLNLDAVPEAHELAGAAYEREQSVDMGVGSDRSEVTISGVDSPEQAVMASAAVLRVSVPKLSEFYRVNGEVSDAVARMANAMQQVIDLVPAVMEEIENQKARSN